MWFSLMIASFQSPSWCLDIKYCIWNTESEIKSLKLKKHDFIHSRYNLRLTLLRHSSLANGSLSSKSSFFEAPNKCIERKRFTFDPLLRGFYFLLSPTAQASMKLTNPIRMTPIEPTYANLGSLNFVSILDILIWILSIFYLIKLITT